MDKRLVDLLEAFEGCRFEECLRLSDQIIKKMNKSEGKKKQNLSDEQTNLLYIARIGSLAATGHIDEANHLSKQKFINPIISPDHSFLFLQICTMALDDRIAQFATKIQEQKDKKKIDINRFVLLSKNFSMLSRSFLKKFMQQKKNEDSLRQIYLEYLQQLHNNKMITYERDRMIPESKDLKLQMISMFLNKFVMNFEESVKNGTGKAGDMNKKIQKGIAELKIRIAIHEGKSQAARQQFKKMTQLPLFYPFPYLRSIKNLSTDQEMNRIFWAKEFLEIFRKNLDLDQYQPIYAYNCEFIDELIKEMHEDISKLQQAKQIPVNQLFSFDQNSLTQLQNYYNSIYTELLQNRKNQQNLKKKDFYYISIKNILLQLLKISSLTQNYQFCQEILTIFKHYFGKTLTFPQEIEGYLKNEQIFTEKYVEEFKIVNQIWKADDKLIWEINLEKMFPGRVLVSDVEAMFQKWRRFFSLYEQNKQNIEKNKPLEKGQRYLSDQFITLAADSVQLFVEKNNTLDKIKEDCYFFIISILEKAIEVSPYNADLKLRAIYFYDKLNYYEKIVQLCDSMDIKAVQFETVGYIYLKAIMNGELFLAQQNLLVKMVRSYQQNYRQSSEYAYKALLGLSFNQCEQNLSYHQNINHSYNFLILLFIFYLKQHPKQPTSRFYLEQILKHINHSKTAQQQKLTFNCDFRVMKNKFYLHEKLDLAEFYGIYNNYLILENECKLKLAFHDYIEGRENIQIEEIIWSWKPRDIYHFKEYRYFQRKLEHEYSGELASEQNTMIQLQNYKMVTHLRVLLLKLLTQIKKGNIDDCRALSKEIHGHILEYNEFISTLTYRRQSRIVPMSRAFISQILPYLSTTIDQITQLKKKIDKSGERKEILSELSTKLIEAVTDHIKWHQRIKVQKEFMSENLFQSEQFLQRMCKMTSYEFKKNYKIK